MSAVEYNSLLFEISQRLDDLDVGRKLLVMCRGKLAHRNEDNMQDVHVFSLFEELEQNGFLGPDKLTTLKDLLKGLKEWSFFGHVKTFEIKRKEYNCLLERIILDLDQLDCLEQLVAICSDRIPEERHSSIQDVRSLFKELEINDSLGIDQLEVLKEILTQKAKTDLLQKVVELEERRNQEDEFEWRKAQAAAIASSASSNLAGVLNIKTVFKVAAGGVFIASAYQLLRRGCTYDQLVTAVSTCVLPAGVQLIHIAEGSVILKVQAENILALDTLWSSYTDGTLRKSLQALFITDEMRELADGEQLEVSVTIEQEEYEKARNQLINEAEVLSSDEPEGQEERQRHYLAQEKLSFITNYLEQTKDTDVYSESTDDDSGKPGSSIAPSEFGFEETSDYSTTKLCLKDLSKEVTEELTFRLNRNKDIRNQFYRSFGLHPDLPYDEMTNIRNIFPDTPVKMLKEVFEALQLFDFAELLEKATKPRTLRPALPLKEIEKLSNVSNRPTKVYSKAEVLIIELCEGPQTAADNDRNDAERVGSFFKALNSQNEITTLTSNYLRKSFLDLDYLAEVKKGEETVDRREGEREKYLKTLLENKIPESHMKEQTRKEGGLRKRPISSGFRLPGRKPVLEKKEAGIWRLEGRLVPNTDERLLSAFYEEEPALKKKLNELTESRKKWNNERKPSIEKQIQEKEEELQNETERLEIGVSAVIDKWAAKLQANHQGKESTLFVVIIHNSLSLDWRVIDALHQTTISISRCLSKKLALIPETKLVIKNNVSPTRRKENISNETLEVNLCGKDVFSALLQLLSKRFDALNLISVMHELQRDMTSRGAPHYDRYNGIQIRENLSCLPRLQKTEQVL